MIPKLNFQCYDPDVQSEPDSRWYWYKNVNSRYKQRKLAAQNTKGRSDQLSYIHRHVFPGGEGADLAATGIN